MKKNILFVSGIPDNDEITVTKAHPNGDILGYGYNGLCDFFLYVNPPDWNKLPVVLDSREFPFQLDPATHCIVNEIAEADSHTKTLDYLSRLLKKHPEIPVFNHPDTVQMTRRDRVYETLKDIPGLRVPQTIRFQPKHLNDILACMQTHDMQYPLILKAAGKHNGIDTLRFDDLDALKNGLYALALDGRSYYLIQFHDTSQDGVFRKFRFVMIQGKVYPRHLRFAEEWMVHSGNANPFMDRHPACYEAEKQLLENFDAGLPPRFLEVMAEIYRRIPIDYTGMDIAIDAQDNVFILELNPNMLMLKISKSKRVYAQQAIRTLHQAVHQAINQKTRGV